METPSRGSINAVCASYLPTSASFPVPVAWLIPQPPPHSFHSSFWFCYSGEPGTAHKEIGVPIQSPLKRDIPGPIEGWALISQYILLSFLIQCFVIVVFMFLILLSKLKIRAVDY